MYETMSAPWIGKRRAKRLGDWPVGLDHIAPRFLAGLEVRRQGQRNLRGGVDQGVAEEDGGVAAGEFADWLGRVAAAGEPRIDRRFHHIGLG